MGSVGDAYDNAMCESFFATLECELLDRRLICAVKKATICDGHHTSETPTAASSASGWAKLEDLSWRAIHGPVEPSAAKGVDRVRAAAVTVRPQLTRAIDRRLWASADACNRCEEEYPGGAGFGKGRA
jgi:hypothetical protein